MKLKYYLRGLGIGIIVTTIVLMISFGLREVNISDEEVIARATVLGMVMPEEDSETDGQKAEVPETEQDGAQEPTVPTGQDAAQEPGTEQVPVPNGVQGPEIAQDGAQESTVPTGQDAAEGYRLVIKKGDVCRVVCENLAANGVISDAESLRKYLFEIGYASNMSVGEYDIPYGLTFEEIAQILKAGPNEAAVE